MVRNINFAILNMHNYMVSYILLFPVNMIFSLLSTALSEQTLFHFWDERRYIGALGMI